MTCPACPCSYCSRFFARYRCNAPLECDCPQCQGMCEGQEEAPSAAPVKWETICKRTEDPKLTYFEGMLKDRGIPCRRNGQSFHAPILEVPAEHLDAAWKMLGEKLPGRRTRFDDMADDHPHFRGAR